MNEGWTRTTLAAVCSMDKVQGAHRGLPYVGLEHVESGTGRFIGSTDTVEVKSSTFRFTPEHVLYGRLRPYLNKVMLPDFEGHCSTEIFPIRPSPDVTRKFLQMWLMQQDVVDRINATATGTRMPRANVGEVLGFEFLLPPVSEQQRIVAILDEAFEGIAVAKANAERSLLSARALFESHLESTFSRRDDGWTERRLGELVTIQNGYAFKSSEYADGGYFVMRIGNVQDGLLSLGNPRYVELTDPRLQRFVLDAGDMLVSLTGNIGRVGVVHDEHLPAVLNQRVARLKVVSVDADAGLLFHFLSSRTFRSGLQAAGQGAAQQNVSTKEIKAVRVWLPQLSAQQLVRSQLDLLAYEVQRLESVYRQKADALDALKTSLMNEAFSGNL